MAKEIRIAIRSEGETLNAQTYAFDKNNNKQVKSEISN